MKQSAGRSEPLAASETLRSSKKTQLIFAAEGVVILAATALLCVRYGLPSIHFPGGDSMSGHLRNVPWAKAYFQLNVMLGGVSLGAFCLVPLGGLFLQWLRMRWRSLYSYACLFCLCGFICIFVVHFGRWQFGGYDQSIVVETGWRLLQGQRAYVDFPTTTPPGFNLGIEWAFRIFGVNWDANLYWTALYACATFLWMYWLLRRLTSGGRRPY